MCSKFYCLLLVCFAYFILVGLFFGILCSLVSYSSYTVCSLKKLDHSRAVWTFLNVFPWCLACSLVPSVFSVSNEWWLLPSFIRSSGILRFSLFISWNTSLKMFTSSVIFDCSEMQLYRKVRFAVCFLLLTSDQNIEVMVL